MNRPEWKNVIVTRLCDRPEAENILLVRRSAKPMIGLILYWQYVASQWGGKWKCKIQSIFKREKAKEIESLNVC